MQLQPKYRGCHTAISTKSSIVAVSPLNLLWPEYCDQCRSMGEIPYQSTQFNMYYTDYLARANATMHMNHKPGGIMQVDCADDTASVIDTDAGEP